MNETKIIIVVHTAPHPLWLTVFMWIAVVILFAVVAYGASTLLEWKMEQRESDLSNVFPLGRMAHEQVEKLSNTSLHHWYRINGYTLYVISFMLNHERFSVTGIQPEDFASYIAFQYIGENKHPYRTVADIEGIPSPDPVRLHLSGDISIQEISQQEALRKDR